MNVGPLIKASLAAAVLSFTGQLAHATEGEEGQIVVTGTKSVLLVDLYGGSLGSNSFFGHTFNTSFADSGGGGGGAAGNDYGSNQSLLCVQASQDFDRQAAAAKATGAKIILVNENHEIGTSSVPSQGTQYYGAIDKLLGDSPGACLAFEASSFAALPDGYRSVAGFANMIGIPVHYIDLDLADSTSVSGANTRDQFMASQLTFLSGQCSRIMSINGTKHVISGADPRVGRVNLKDNLGANATVVEGRPIEACQ